ncbi:MAG: SAM-dependent methyltransferase [Candidatus Sericytochromatia bacterium]
MQIEIQAPVPYESSLLWELHRRYYQESGAEVFFRQEVPYNISSNPCYARQAVHLFLASLSPEAAADTSALQILEVGAGLGVFALNFLAALEAEAPGLLPRVRYLLSDYSRPTLEALAAHEAFGGWMERGLLEIVLLDGERPREYQTLDAQHHVLPADFQLVMANYVLSTLPTAVLSRQPQGWFQQHTSLVWLPLGEAPEPALQQAYQQQLAQRLRQFNLLGALAEDHPQRALFAALHQAQLAVATQLEAALLPHNTELLSWLSAQLQAAWSVAWGQSVPAALLHTLQAAVIQPLLLKPSYPPAELFTDHRFRAEAPDLLFADTLHQQAAEALTADMPLATLSYPRLGLQAVEQLCTQVRPGGLLLISDKAYADKRWLQGARAEEATRHGESLAHPVNFLLLEAVLRARGYGVARTQDEAFALHSLLIAVPEVLKPSENTLSPAVATCFEQHFVLHPGNELSHALLEGGHALLRQESLEQALRALQKALRYRPGDGTLQYLVAVCLLNQERYADAIGLLQQPHDDVFGLLNREILLAEAYRLTGQDAEAVNHYRASLRYGENSQTYYNLALSLLELQAEDAAREALHAAAVLDPDDPDIQGLLSEI